MQVDLPMFLRIERVGGTITTSYSFDGEVYTPHMTVQTAGSGLNQQNFRVGMNQASTRDAPAVALFTDVEELVIEDQRPPAIFRVEPNIGLRDGGTEVTITGERLAETTDVTIGGVDAEIVQTNDTFVVVKVGGAERDTVGDVVVRTRTGVSSLSDGFQQIGRPFIRTDCNGDGETDISDAISFLQFIFLGNTPCQCFDAADSNADLNLDLADAIFSLGHIFQGTAAPPSPYPQPGLPSGLYVPCAVPELSLGKVVEIVLPDGESALREGDVFQLVGGDFPQDPGQIRVFLGSTPAEVTGVTRAGLTAKVGLVGETVSSVLVSVLIDIDRDISPSLCKLVQCSPFVIALGNPTDLRVDLVASEGVVSLGSSRAAAGVGGGADALVSVGEAVVPFNSQNLEPDGIIGVVGNIILPPVAGGNGLSRGSQLIDIRLRVRGDPAEAGQLIGEQVAEAIRDQLTGGGDSREIDVLFDPDQDAIVFKLEPDLREFLATRSLKTAFDISIYGFGRPRPCMCVADLDEDGVAESYTPLVDDRGYAWCRLYKLWKACGGLPTWEYFIPRNCVFIESGTTCESDGANTYPVFPLPHPHSISTNVKSTMVNRPAYCHIRQHKLWNRCKLRDLELLGNTQVPHFPRSSVVIKTDWRNDPPGLDSQYYSYPYDNGGGGPTTDKFLVGWHFTDKCIDKWTWCDLYMPSSQGGNGGCGGMNADRPPALDGLGIDDYYMCVNVRDTDSITSCGNNFFPECNVSNCMSCHSPTGGGGFSGANSAWSNSIGDGTLGSDFLYSLTSGPAIPTGGLSDGDHPSCNN